MPTSTEKTVSDLTIPRWRISKYTTDIWHAFMLVQEAGSSGEVYSDVNCGAAEFDSNDASSIDEFTPNAEVDAGEVASPASTIASPTYGVPSPPSAAGKSIPYTKLEKSTARNDTAKFNPETQTGNGIADSISAIRSPGGFSGDAGDTVPQFIAGTADKADVRGSHRDKSLSNQDTAADVAKGTALVTCNAELQSGWTPTAAEALIEMRCRQRRGLEENEKPLLTDHQDNPVSKGVEKIISPGGEFKPADSRAIPVLIGRQTQPNRNQEAPDVVRCPTEIDNQPELNDSCMNVSTMSASVASAIAKHGSADNKVHIERGDQPVPARLAKPRTIAFYGQLKRSNVEVQVEQHRERIDVWQLDSIVSYVDPFIYIPERDPRWAFRTDALRKHTMSPTDGKNVDTIDSKCGKDVDGMDFEGNYPVYRKGRKVYGIRYDGNTRVIMLNRKPWTVPMGMARVIFQGTGLLAFGGPSHEVIVNDEYFHVPFGGEEKDVVLKNGRRLTISLPGDRPKILVMGEIKYPNDINSGVTENASHSAARETEVERSKSQCREDDTSREHRSSESREREVDRCRSQRRSASRTENNIYFPEARRKDEFHQHRSQIKDLRRKLTHLRDRNPDATEETRHRRDRSFDHSPPSKVRKMGDAKDDASYSRYCREWSQPPRTRPEIAQREAADHRRRYFVADFRRPPTVFDHKRSPTRSARDNTRSISPTVTQLVSSHPNNRRPDDVSHAADGSPKPGLLMRPPKMVPAYRHRSFFSREGSVSRACRTSTTLGHK